MAVDIILLSMDKASGHSLFPEMSSPQTENKNTKFIMA
jgi:hypothetical protein